MLQVNNNIFLYSRIAVITRYVLITSSHMFQVNNNIFLYSRIAVITRYVLITSSRMFQAKQYISRKIQQTSTINSFNDI